MEKEASLSTYFEFEGLPVVVRRGNLPVMTNRRGRKVILYDAEKFYREAHVISDARYIAMVSKVTPR